MDSKNLQFRPFFEQWQPFTDTTPDWLNEIITSFAPPPSVQAIKLIWQWLSYSGTEASFQYLSEIKIPDSLPRDPFTKNPLFGAHLEISKISKDKNIHTFLSKILGLRSFWDDKEIFDLNIYYSDCLAIRKGLKKTLELFPDYSDIEQTFTHNLHLENFIEPDVRIRCLRLINRDRIPGVKDFSRNFTPYEESHLQRIPSRNTELVNNSGSTTSNRISINESELFDDQFKDFPSIQNKLSNPVNASEPSDPDTEVLYRRKAPDLRTRGDDRRAVSVLPWFLSVRDCRSESDLNRLPLSHVAESIYALHQRKKPREHAFVWIIATTGVSVPRLSELEVVFSSDQVLKDAASIRLQTIQQMLEIPLVDGASGSIGACHRIVTLHLPSQIVAAITSRGESFPFAQTAGYADQTLRRHFQYVPGVIPTCRRIRATAEANIVGLAYDTTAALTLKGEYGNTSRGGAAYRTITDAEIVKLHGLAVSQLRLVHCGNSLIGSSVIPHLSAPITRSCDKLGSIKAAQLIEYKPLFEYLSTQIEILIALSHQEKDGGRVRIETLIDLNHASAQLAYMAFLLSTGARPIVKRAEIHLIGTQWYIQDKDSVNFTERRAIPAMPEVVEQMLDQRQLTEHLSQSVRFAHFNVRKTFDQHGFLPLWMEVLKNRLSFRTIKQSDTDELWNKFKLQPRATRHTFVNTLRLRLPEAELNALLGHVGGGWQRESLMSMATAQFSTMTVQAIKALLQEAGFHLCTVYGRHAE